MKIKLINSFNQLMPEKAIKKGQSRFLDCLFLIIYHAFRCSLMDFVKVHVAKKGLFKGQCTLIDPERRKWVGTLPKSIIKNELGRGGCFIV
jgi:hypothetical protein